MTYATYDFYSGIYGFGLPEAAFNRLSWDASRFMDQHTTGVDGFAKLCNAFPTDEYSSEAIKRCCCKLIQTMHGIEEAESLAFGYNRREDGTITPKIATAVSSGSESISYASNGSHSVSAAVTDGAERARLYENIVRESLSGITDDNGVNLLYMGGYPTHV